MQGRVIPASELSAKEIEIWDGLCRNHPGLANPYLTPHYTRALASVAPYVFVCVLMAGGRPVGFLPFQFRSRFHRLLRAAEMPGIDMNDNFGLIAEPGIGIRGGELLNLADLHVLTFGHLDEVQLDYGLTGESPQRAFVMRLDREASYWQMLRQTHRKFARHTEQGERQASRELGPLRFTPMESDWREPMENLVRYKEQQYRRTGKPSLFSVAWRRRLLDKLAECHESTCTGVLSTLYAGDTWLASHFGLKGSGILHYCFPVYNPDLGRFGPGRLMLKALIENARDMGIDSIELGEGEARYKQDCANSFQMRFRGRWHVSSARSFFGRAAESLRWRMEQLREPRRRNNGNSALDQA
jgi:CelD/BcsL family acetyltransferase involved in cellulose biosynthesis